MKNILVEFYKDCVNYTNVKGLLFWTLVPYALTGNWIRGIQWGSGYLIIVIILWILIRKGIIYKRNEKS